MTRILEPAKTIRKPETAGRYAGRLLRFPTPRYVSGPCRGFPCLFDAQGETLHAPEHIRVMLHVAELAGACRWDELSGFAEAFDDDELASPRGESCSGVSPPSTSSAENRRFATALLRRLLQRLLRFCYVSATTLRDPLALLRALRRAVLRSYYGRTVPEEIPRW